MRRITLVDIADPLHNDPILEQYMELAKPYELIINMEDFRRSATIGLKIEENDKKYGNYAEIGSLRNDSEIRGIIHHLKSTLDNNKEEHFIGSRLTKSDKKEIRERIHRELHPD